MEYAEYQLNLRKAKLNNPAPVSDKSTH